MRAKWFGIVGILFVSLSTTSVFGLPLAGHPNAYLGIWSGSTPFSSGGSFSGHVEWAVFGPGDFPYAGYTPDAGELTYAYQVFVEGTAPLSTFTVALIEPADTDIGSFSDLGVFAPTSATLIPFSDATWTFAGVPQGSSTYGLAFTSFRTPQILLGAGLNGGESADIIPLPSPGPIDIPEPGTLGLLAVSSLVLRRKSRD